MLAREGVRALGAFCLYVVLYPIWTMVGADHVYDRVILMLAAAVLRVTQHFPVYSGLENHELRYLDFLAILGISYFAVSSGMGWKKRLLRFAGLFIVILVIDVVAVVLQAEIGVARELWRKEGLILLLPREYQIISWLKYLLFEFGLQLGPFILFALGAAWNSGISVSLPAWWGTADHDQGLGVGAKSQVNRGQRRTPWVVGLAIVMVVATSLGVWKFVRESDRRHVQTHVLLGNLFFDKGRWARAEGQYRVAIGEGSLDGQAWFNLAVIRRDQGESSESIRLLQSGLEVVKDPSWQHRMEKAASRWLSEE